MKIRIKFPGGLAKTIETVGDHVCWKDIVDEAEGADLLASEHAFLVGHPPKRHSIPNDPTLPLVQIKHGDKIELISKDTNSTPAAKNLNEKNGSVLKIVEMPDDNSCLFHCIAHIFCKHSGSKASDLRSMVAKAIISDPATYTEAFLGQSPQSYCEWIQKEGSWGGAVELSIFSLHFSTQIASVDIASGGRCDIFGEGERQGDDFKSRCYLIYNGVHYNVLASKSTGNCLFRIDDDQVMMEAIKMATLARQSEDFCNPATFTLKCDICGQGIVGESGANEHAMSTGHTSFVQYKR